MDLITESQYKAEIETAWQIVRSERAASRYTISELREENKKLREALRLSANGLRHCARWNISDETEKAIMMHVASIEALLTPNTGIQPPAMPVG